ncbi:hypothetical protein TRVA0_010S02432 [Trichomonascus vanleenenianus]|uniref:uncharacterized protein n=1 Tax=Trichomonascus vanleenenianus TaxID=2268995 RepID=UPI003ECB7CD5
MLVRQARLGRAAYSTARSAGRPATQNQSVAKQIQAALRKDDVAGAAKQFLSAYKPSRAQELPSAVYNDLFRRVYFTNKKAASADLISSKDLYNKYLEGGVAVGWVCSYVIMEDVIAGKPETGLESWIKFLETLGDAKMASAMVNREAAWAALVAYTYNCYLEKLPVDTTIAQKLVPLNKYPRAHEILSLSGINSVPKEALEKILEYTKQIRMDSLDINGSAFLKSLDADSAKDLEDSYAEVVEKSNATGEKLSPVTYARFIACFSEASRVQRAFEVWNDMQNAGVSPTTLTWNSLLKAGALTRESPDLVVEHIKDEMEAAKVKPDGETFATLMEFYFRTRRAEVALDIYNNVKAGKVSGVAPTLKMFSIAINGYLKMGEIETAEAMLAEGRRQGYAPTSVVYNSFIRTYIKEGQFDKIQGVLDEMQANKIAPDVITYTSIIDATFKHCRRVGSSPDVSIEALLNEMSANGIKANTVAMTSIISGLSKSSRDIESARAVFDALIRKRLAPNARTFATIIDGELTVGDPERAIYYFNLMPKLNLFKSTPIYNQLINWLSKRGDLAKATDIFFQLVNDSRTDPNFYSYYFILQGADNHNDAALVQRVVDAMGKHKYKFPLGERLPKLLLKWSKLGVTVPPHILQQATADAASSA